MTLIMISLVASFAYYRYTVMVGKDDSKILIVHHDNWFTQDFIISTQKDEFQVAFAFIDYDNVGNESNFVQADYGEVKVFYKRWGDEGIPGTHYYDLPTHPCSLEELGLEGDSDNSLFWPVNPVEKADLQSYAPKL